MGIVDVPYSTCRGDGQGPIDFLTHLHSDFFKIPSRVWCGETPELYESLCNIGRYKIVIFNGHHNVDSADLIVLPWSHSLHRIVLHFNDCIVDYYRDGPHSDHSDVNAFRFSDDNIFRSVRDTCVRIGESALL